MRSLTTRLVVIAVLLLAVVSIGISAAITLVMRDHLTAQLDRDVLASVGRAEDRGGPRRGPGDDGPRPEVIDLGNQPPGTVVAFPGSGTGYVEGDRDDEREGLDDRAIESLDDVPLDGDVHTVRGSFGSYRVTAVRSSEGALVIGLPTDDVDDTVASLMAAEAGFVLAGVVAAGLVGLVVVRRQLAPLREVADTAHRVSETPLSRGEIDLGDRVPARLTDERTEVGQVGSALNTLLDHVERSLEARQRSEQQVRQFVADASHELRSPLATIQGYAELARRRPDDAVTALGRVETESVRMTALVEDLLLLARLDSGRALAAEPVDVTRVLLEAVADAQVLAPDHRWALELPAEPLVVVGDEQRLHQVVVNLLTNARKHTPPGTVVTVRGRSQAERVVVEVHDGGPGFTADLADSAFDRFVRGDVARTRTGGSGAGLGLAIVRAIVEAHRGSVALDSRPGDTTVRVDLPARQRTVAG